MNPLRNAMLNRTRFGVAAACLLLCGLQAVQAADTSKLTASVGIDRTQGNYGGETDTTITSIPFMLRYQTGPWLLGLTTEWLSVKGDAFVNRDIGRFGESGTDTTRTESGLGDIVASVTHELGMTANGTAIDLTGKIKLGTADETKGLGTGENDLRIEVDVYRSVAQFVPFGTLGYKFLGDPPGLNLRNVFYAAVGSTMKIDDVRSVGLMWYGQQKTTANGARQSDITAFYIRNFTPEWKAQFYGLLGLADGSPDIGAGAIVTHTF